MKKILKIIGFIILAVILFVVIAGLFISKDYHFERDITINAPREKVWSNVNTLHGMHKWNPFIEADPNIQITYGGQDGTPGATYAWKGNKDVGSGVQTISKVEAPSKIDTHLHFIEPFESDADAFLNLADVSGATKVTWGFDMKYSYPMNVMKLFVNMDEMMGKSYNSGLTKLKALSEAN
ncbi:MAG: SRPBCC family protein [Agriterribacter sp.]